MKIKLDRLHIANNVVTKRLPLVIELDALKCIVTDSEKVETQVSPEYRSLHDTDKEVVSYITFKWADGESTIYCILQDDMDVLHDYIVNSYDNVFNAELDETIRRDMEESEEEDYDAEEEIEEEELLDDEPELPFPSNETEGK